MKTLSGNFRFFQLSLLNLLISIFFCQSVFAQPSVKIVFVKPDVRNKEILIDSNIQEVKFAAQTNPPGLQINWELSGSGKFDGETTGLASIYAVPNKISDESEIVIVTVTVTDTQGKTAKDSVKFTLLTPPPDTPTPVPPTPTSKPTFTPFPSPTVSLTEQMLRKAEEYFTRQWYTTPEETNAFDLCKELLRQEPDNQRAREILEKIKAFYKRNINIYHQQGDSEKVEQYYQRYRRVAEYMLDTLGEKQIAIELQEVKELLFSRVSDVTPSPTEGTVVPLTPTISVPTWIPNCSPGSGKLEDVERVFSIHLTRYKELRDQEQQGFTRDNEINSAINDIICDLMEIEKILTQNYDETKNEAVLRRIQETQTIRKSYEQEIRDRLGMP